MLQEILLIKKNCVLSAFFLFLSSFLVAQNSSIQQARKLIQQDKPAQAVAKYAELTNKNSTATDYLTEYAYALALSGVFDGALMNLDKKRQFSVMSGEDYFYTSQIFKLMGYGDLSNEFAKRHTAVDIPDWLSSAYISLAQKYLQKTNINQDDYVITFKRANYLAANGLCFQSIVLYEGLIDEYSNQYLLRIGYSIPLEKVGLNKLAAEELETGILLMPDDPQFAEAKQAFNQRLVQLKQQPENVAPNEQPELTKKLNKFNPQTMLYIGGMFSKNYTSLNSRFGVYFSNSFNGSLNLGLSGNSTAMNLNVGLSGYQRLGNVLVVGLGLNDLITKDNSTLSIVPSLGFSFINSKRNSSWDIFFNVYYPLQEGANTMYGISIGKSFYFGTR